MMKKIAGLFFFVFLLAGLSAGRAYAVPQSSVVVSSSDVSLDEKASIEITLIWPKSEGEYHFVDKDWKLKNLEVANEGHSDETYQQGGKQWRKKTLRFEFKPKEIGPAGIGYLKLKYLNAVTQETGAITVARGVDFKVAKAKRSGFWLGNMAVILIGVVVVGAVLMSLYSKASAKSSDQREKLRDRQAYDATTDRILNPEAKTQKEIFFEWGKRLKTFVIYQYQLPKSTMTESEALELLKSKNIPKQDLEQLTKLFERLSQAKFTPKDLPEETFKRLQDDILQYMKGKRVVGDTG